MRKVGRYVVLAEYVFRFSVVLKFGCNIFPTTDYSTMPWRRPVISNDGLFDDQLHSTTDYPTMDHPTADPLAPFWIIIVDIGLRGLVDN